MGGDEPGDIGDFMMSMRTGRSTGIERPPRSRASKSLPLVSVIVPCFNAARFLSQTLDSLRSQTYRNLEILVIDDGSIDETASIAKAFAERDERMVLLRKFNGGLASARNFGLDHASGKYVAFIDGDDFWAPGKVEKHVAHLEADGGVGISYSGTQYVDSAGEPLRHCRLPKTRSISAYYLYCRNPITTGSTAVFRREVFDYHRFDERMVGALGGNEDVDCWLRIAFAPPRKWKFEGIPELLTFYRINPSGLSHDFDRHLASARYTWAKSFAYAPEIAARYAQLAEAFQLRFYARRAIASKQFTAARRFIWLALRTDPRILIREPAHTGVTLLAALQRSRQ